MRIIGKSFRNSLKPIIYAHTAGASLLLSTFCSFAMLAMRGLTFSSRLFSRRISQQRSYTTEVPPALSPQKMEGPGEDPRPPWVYASTRLVSFVVIPAVGLYSIFFYDFGDHEHVFQPPRRWAKSLINDVFTLSSAEEKLLFQEKQQQLQQQTVTAATPEKAL